MPTCYHCHKSQTSSNGLKSSPFLVIFSKPQPIKENKWGMKEHWSSQNILGNELKQAGLPVPVILDMRTTYLWKHQPNKKEECLQDGYTDVLQEAKGKQAILLIGAAAVETFTDYSVSEVTGLSVLSNQLSAPVIVAMEDVSGVMMKHGAVGEIRFACQNFVNLLKEKELI